MSKDWKYDFDYKYWVKRFKKIRKELIEAGAEIDDRNIIGLNQNLEYLKKFKDKK